jgi:hypothetical protein
MADDDNVIPLPQFVRMLADDKADLSRLWKTLGQRSYRLVGHTPVRTESLLDFEQNFVARYEEIARSGIDPWRIAFTDFGGRLSVSTVFLGLDHRFTGDGPPLIFETMVFGGTDLTDRSCSRCTTWEQAEAEHARVVEALRKLKVVK